MTWRSEFGRDWGVPRQITDLVEEGILGDISDSSTDEMPVFARVLPEGATLQVVVDHQDRARRAYPDGSRFLVQHLPTAGRLGSEWAYDDAADAARRVLAEIFHALDAAVGPSQPTRRRGTHGSPTSGGPEEWRP